MKKEKKMSKNHLLQDTMKEENFRKEKFNGITTKESMAPDLKLLLQERPDIQRIGILGGTFNPIHIGHIQVAQRALDIVDLDLLVFMPTGKPPHKSVPYLVTASDRLKMCQLATQNMSHCYVSDMEIQRSGKSYTVETLRDIKSFAPDVKLFWIMGADMFLTLGDWYKSREVLSLCTPCVVPRNTDTIESLHEYAACIGLDNFLIIPFKPVPISSTKIRNLVLNGEKISNMVPDVVQDYIISHHLYREAFKMTQEELIAIVKEKVSPARFYHSVCVKKAAEELASRFGGDVQKAGTAGIVHDILKDTSSDIQLQILNNSDIVLSPEERAEPKLWHAIAGSVYIREQLNFVDIDIINAVRYHTTGRANMTLMEKILYVADYISDDRTFDGVDKLRKLAKKDLDKTVFEGLKFSIIDLAERQRFVHPDTVAGYNEYISHIRSL